MIRAAVATLALLLAGCGGGNATPEDIAAADAAVAEAASGPRATIGPPDCTNPEVCR